MRGTLLRGLFKYKKEDWDQYHQLLDTIADHFFYSDRHRLAEELNRTYNQSSNGKIHSPKDVDHRSLINSTKRNYKKWLLIFVAHYGIPAHYFQDADKV